MLEFISREMVCSLAKGQLCGLPCYIKKKGNIEKRMGILMSFKKFNDSCCAESSYMEENSCKW